jgi:hypothetical protein
MVFELTLARPRQSARRRRIGLAVVTILALATPAVIGVLVASGGGGAKGPVPVSKAAFEEETGIRIVRVAAVGGGGLVDVRFQVLDPDKAIAVHDGDSPLVLMDEESAEVVSTAFHGRHSGGTTQTGLNPGATYYLLFSNSGGALRPGDRASVLLGDVRLEHVLVQ